MIKLTVEQEARKRYAEWADERDLVEYWHELTPETRQAWIAYTKGRRCETF